MKKLYTLMITVLIFFSAVSQQISVSSFEFSDKDFDALLHYPVKDKDGNLCALIKVNIKQIGFVFEGDPFGIIQTKIKNGEYWVYLPSGSKNLTIRHQQNGVLGDYTFPIKIEKAKVYRMKLTIEESFFRSFDTVVSPEIDSIYEDDDEYFEFAVVEDKPLYPGGDEALMQFISDSTKYPEIARINNIQGRVFVKFVINKNGEVTKVQVVKGVDPYLDAEAVRVVKLLPNWTPGKQRGKTVPVSFIIPINFKLTNEGK